VEILGVRVGDRSSGMRKDLSKARHDIPHLLLEGTAIAISLTITALVSCLQTLQLYLSSLAKYHIDHIITDNT